MSRWDWNRIAYVLFVLAVFSALVKVGGMTLADSGPAPPRTADAAPATGDREPPWYMGTFLELEDDRGFLFGDPPAESAGRSAPAEPPVTKEDVAGAASSEAPVFYRPSKGTGAGPVCGNLSDASNDSRVVFPLAGAHADSYSDTWGAPRPQGGHEGTDLMIPAGTPEYAMTDGTVVAVSGANENGWNTLGGYTVMIEAADTVGPIKAGDLFYYAHMDAPSELPIGSSVRAGQVVGYAGDTGQGPEVTTGLFPAHLHLGWYDGSGGRTEVESGAMNPYPLLEWLKGNGGSVSGGSNASYCEAPQTDGPKPSGGDDDWPVPANPGVQPDLDTGSDHAHPSPAVEQRADDGDVPRDEPRESTPEEPREVRLGAPGPVDEGDDDPDRDFGGEIPGDGSDDGSGDDDRETAPGDLPDIVGRIVGDGRVTLPADDPLRLRDRIRTVFSGLLRDHPDRRGPLPGEDEKHGRGDDERNGGDGRKDSPGKDDPPQNDPERGNPERDDPPDAEDEGSPDKDEGQNDQDGATEDGTTEDGDKDRGEVPADASSEDARDEEPESSAQDGDTPPPSGD